MFSTFNAVGISALGEDPEDTVALRGEATVVLDWEVRIFAATHEFITRDTDSPPLTAFYGTLQKAFRIDRSIVGSNRVGEEVTIGLGEVTLTNTEGDYDFLSVGSSSLGQAISIKMGNRRRPYAEWKTVLNGYTVSQTIDRDEITFRLRDAAHLLEQPSSPNVYGGTGDEDGTEDQTGKRKQRVFGACYNVSAPLVIPTALAYQVNDGRIEAIDAVYIRGVAQVFDADYATVALMNAASLSVGEYATCLTEGWFRIAVAGGSEIGQVTCDVQGDKVGGIYVETTGTIVRRLLSSAAGIDDPDGLSTSTFSRLETLQPAVVGYVVPFGSEEVVRTSVGNLMGAIGGWCGARRSGLFEVRRLDGASAVSTGVYDKRNIVDVARVDLPDDLSPPTWRVRVGWSRNWTVQTTDLAGSVTDARRAYLAEPVRYAAAFNEKTRLDFPPGKELVIDSYFRDEADASDEADRRLALFGVPRELYLVKLAERLYIHELGQTVTVSFPRLSLDEPVGGVIVKLTEDDVDGVEMVVFV